MKNTSINRMQVFALAALMVLFITTSCQKEDLYTESPANTEINNNNAATIVEIPTEQWQRTNRATYEICLVDKFEMNKKSEVKLFARIANDWVEMPNADLNYRIEGSRIIISSPVLQEDAMSFKLEINPYPIPKEKAFKDIDDEDYKYID